jgi:hypothetical protein
MPCVALDIKQRLDENQAQSQRSFDSLQGELSKLTDRLSSLTTSMQSSMEFTTSSTTAASAPSMYSSTATAPVAQEMFGEMPQSYSLHNLNSRSVFLVDGTEHRYYALPEEYPLEQAPQPMSHSAVQNVGVTVPLYVAAQVVGLAPVFYSKTNHTAGSGPMLVHNQQLPMTVQDVSSVFTKMPVYDVYEEDTNASLNFLGELRDTAGQHKRYDYERPIHDRVETHGAAKLYSGESDKELLTVCCTSDEKSTEAAPILCAQEATMVHNHDEKSEVNVAVVLTELNGFEKRHGDEKLSMEMCDVELIFTCLVKAPVNNIDALSWSECPDLADVQYNSMDVCIWDPGIRPFFSMYCWLQSLTAGAVTGQASSLLQTPEPTTWQCQVASASYVWDPGTMLLLYKSRRLLLFAKEKETVPLIPEQWSFWFNDVHYCQIFQKCREMSHLMYWHHDIKFGEIALWLITFNPP